MPCTFIYGADDFLVNQEAKRLFDSKTTGQNDWSSEVLSGYVQNLSELEKLIQRIRESLQTLGFMGSSKVIWVRNTNILSDQAVAKSEGAKAQVAILLELLQGTTDADIILSASPVDRRTKEFKALEKHCDSHMVAAPDTPDNALVLIHTHCQSLGVTIAPDAATLILEKIQGSTRLLFEELRKLATYLGTTESVITRQHVLDLVPDFGEGDFFEVAESFFARDLDWTLRAIRQYFFIHKEPRPLLSALQNRTRLLIQLKALLDAGEIKTSGYGLSKPMFEAATHKYAAYFGSSTEKTSFNVFSQNLWYLGKLASTTLTQFTLKQLLDSQKAFLQYFEQITQTPHAAESHLEALVLRCIGPQEAS